MKDKTTYDFSCWVLKYNGVSVYGRIYQKDSLKNNNEILVPLCWNHDHNNPDSILGEAILEHRDGEGVYAYCTIHNKPIKEDIIKLIRDGDCMLSLYINRIKYDGNIITDAAILDVSLVPARIDPDEAYYPVLRDDLQVKNE